MNGVWTIEFTTYVANITNPQSINLAKLEFTSGNTPQFGANAFGQTFVLGTLSNSGFNLKVPSDPIDGIGPGVAITSDNSLGGFSESRRTPLYFFPPSALTQVDDTSTNPGEENNTDIMLFYSDDGGQRRGDSAIHQSRRRRYCHQLRCPGHHCSRSNSVNDDNWPGRWLLRRCSLMAPATGAVRNTSRREQLNPTTRTLVVQTFTGYDARYDAADARVARFVTTSIDGGQSFGGQTYLNQPNQVYNAVTGQAQDLGPIPDNISAGNPNSPGQFYFGGDQGMTVYRGHIYAVWTGNNTGGNDGKERLNILTSDTTFASGPRIIDSTQGVVSTPEDVVNPAVNNTPAFQYIDVTFDRPIDPSTFLTSAVHLYYRDINTPGTLPPTDDSSDDNIIDYPPQIPIRICPGQRTTTTPLVQRIPHPVLNAPLTAPGTYSYSIDPVMTNGYFYYGFSAPSAPLVFNANDSTNALTGEANIPVPQSGSD